MYGLFVWNQSTSVPSIARRTLKWFASYDAAMRDHAVADGSLIIDNTKPCRVCGEPYDAEVHLTDGIAHDLTDWKIGDQRHWFID